MRKIGREREREWEREGKREGGKKRERDRETDSDKERLREIEGGWWGRYALGERIYEFSLTLASPPPNTPRTIPAFLSSIIQRRAWKSFSVIWALISGIHRFNSKLRDLHYPSPSPIHPPSTYESHSVRILFYSWNLFSVLENIINYIPTPSFESNRKSVCLFVCYCLSQNRLKGLD